MMLADLIFGPYEGLLLPGLVLGLAAQGIVLLLYHRHLRADSESDVDGAQTARAVLDDVGLTSVQIGEATGYLSSQYDPTRRTIFLSQDSFYGRSMAELGMALHEVGRAIQEKESPRLFRLRHGVDAMTGVFCVVCVLVLIVKLAATKLTGADLDMFNVAQNVALGAYALLTLMQMVTWYAEYDAGRRVAERLQAMHILTPEEVQSMKPMLRVAAWSSLGALACFGLVKRIISFFQPEEE